MIWFGSSSGVAVSNIFPEAKSVGRWLAGGWYVPIGYVIGFLVMLGVLGWNPAMTEDAQPMAARTATGAPSP